MSSQLDEAQGPLWQEGQEKDHLACFNSIVQRAFGVVNECAPGLWQSIAIHVWVFRPRLAVRIRREGTRRSSRSSSTLATHGRLDLSIRGDVLDMPEMRAVKSRSGAGHIPFPDTIIEGRETWSPNFQVRQI